MLTTTAEARKRICLMDMGGRDNIMSAGHCLGEECSAWHWEAVKDRTPPEERLGYCGMIGCVGRVVRKHPRRTVETTMVPF